MTEEKKSREEQLKEARSQAYALGLMTGLKEGGYGFLAEKGENLQKVANMVSVIEEKQSNIFNAIQPVKQKAALKILDAFNAQG